MKLLDKISTFVRENPATSSDLVEDVFINVPYEILNYISYFNTSVDSFVYEYYSNNMIFIDSTPLGYWENNQWLPLFSFYLDQKAGINHFLRNRRIEGYLPIQQIYEEFILAVTTGKLNEFESHERYKNTHLGRLILDCFINKDLFNLEKSVYGKLLGNVFCSEEFHPGSSPSFFKIDKLNQAILNRNDYSVVFFGNGNHLSTDNLELSTVQSFLDTIYMNISDEVRINSYGQQWLLFNVETNDLIIESEVNRNALLSESKFSKGVFVVLIKNSQFLPYKLRVI